MTTEKTLDSEQIAPRLVVTLTGNLPPKPKDPKKVEGTEFPLKVHVISLTLDTRVDGLRVEIFRINP